MRTRAAALLALALVSCGEKSSTERPEPPAAPWPVVLATAQAGASTTIAVGQTISLSGLAKDGSGQTISGATFTWASANTAVATVSDGTVTGVSSGTAGIPPRAAASPASLTVTVTAASGGNGTTIGSGGGTVTLTGVATVTFPAGAFAATTGCRRQLHQ